MSKVFISYSHDSPDHSNRVLSFAQALRRNGIDIELDQFHKDKIINWPRWCNEQISRDHSDFVLCVCTAKYKQRIEGNVPSEQGRGVHWEGDHIYQELYDEKGNRRFIPVLLGNEEQDAIPDILRGWTFCRVNDFEMTDSGYEHVVRILTAQATVIKNPLGSIPYLLPNQVQIPGPSLLGRKEGNAPPRPPLVIGREDDLRKLKEGLLLTSEVPMQILTAIRGWPGIGKTTIAALLAHDPDIVKAFPDGTLWTSLGLKPKVLAELDKWGRVLGSVNVGTVNTLTEASVKLTAMLRNKRMLLIIDDVWEPEHALPFMVGGRDCATVITTRENKVAQALAPKANNIYRLPVLTDGKALELLNALAPSVVKDYPNESTELVRELEGLPLALQVAGHMLNVEESYGFSVSDLIKELHEGAAILEGTAPADRTCLANETTPTIAVLFQRSTDRLDSLARDCYAYLGVFAPKPATFDLEAMKEVWQLERERAEAIVRTLVDRGLLEFVREMERYQMHAMLVTHAKSLLKED